MTNTSPLIDKEHDAIDLLLPWYVNGGLDADDHERVDAHLAVCPKCRVAVVDEAALRHAYRDLPVEAAASWTVIRERIEQHKRPASAKRGFLAWRRGSEGRSRTTRRTRRFATVFATQAAVMLVLVAAAGPLMQAFNPFADSYRGLSSNTPPVVGNVVAIFRPDTTEGAMRETLRKVGATIVDGPTTADAYVLRVAPDRRAEQLAALRAQPTVLLAEPIDGEDRP